MIPTGTEQKTTCQRCGQNIVFPEALAGQDISCPHCGRETTLPKAPPSFSKLMVSDIDRVPKPLHPIFVGISSVLYLVWYIFLGIVCLFIIIAFLRFLHLAWGR